MIFTLISRNVDKNICCFDTETVVIFAIFFICWWIGRFSGTQSTNFYRFLLKKRWGNFGITPTLF